MSQLLMALPGKGSGAMQEVYRRAARMNPAGPEFWLKFPRHAGGFHYLQPG